MKMTNKKDKSTFEMLNKVDVNKYKKKKGRFDYLSWAWAVTELLKVKPEATWHTHEYEVEGRIRPYMVTEAGIFVKVSVTIDGITRSQIHPVLDNRNMTIKDPNAQQINTSIQRCLAKAIALHGLGLYIFAGEDLPESDPLTDEQKEELLAEAKDMEASYIKTINEHISEGKVNATNVKQYIVRIKQMKSEIKKKGGK